MSGATRDEINIIFYCSALLALNAKECKVKRLLYVGMLLAILMTLVAGCASVPAEGQSTQTKAGEVVKTVTEYEDDKPFSLPGMLSFALLGMSIAAVGIAVWQKYGDEYRREVKSVKGKVLLSLALFVGFLIMSSVRVVPMTYVAVLRQAFPVRQYTVIGPGTHWVWPFVTRVNLYTTRVRPMKLYDISADTNSTGRPAIYPDVVTWFRLPIIEGQESNYTGIPVEPALLLDLDWRYGPNYEDSFLKEKIIASTKETSGAEEYDFFGSQREEAQNRIQTKLTDKLEGLVSVSDLLISTFSYTPDFEERLKALSQKQVELEQAGKDVAIAEQRRLEAQKNAEKRLEEGKGEANYQRQIAEGQAYGYSVLAAELAKHPELLQLEWIKKWGGSVPTYWGGTDGPNFLFQVPTPADPSANVTK
jgi:regulator of protease activity HflC (stomatin/prohibitin superfamily)